MMRIEINLETGETVEHDDFFPEPVVEARRVPFSISRKQFYMQGAAMGICSQAEALAAVTTAALPVALQGIVDGMSNENAKWEAKMQLLGSNNFYRDSPWALVFAAVLHWSDEQVDQFWIAADRL